MPFSRQNKMDNLFPITRYIPASYTLRHVMYGYISVYSNGEDTMLLYYWKNEGHYDLGRIDSNNRRVGEWIRWYWKERESRRGVIPAWSTWDYTAHPGEAPYLWNPMEPKQPLVKAAGR